MIALARATKTTKEYLTMTIENDKRETNTTPSDKKEWTRPAMIAIPLFQTAAGPWATLDGVVSFERAS